MQRIDGCLQGNRGWASGSGLPEGGMQEPGRKAEAGAPKAFSTIPKKRESIKSRSSQDLFVLLKPSVLSKSDWLYSPSTRCVPMFVTDKSIHAANRLSFAADGLAMEAQFEDTIAHDKQTRSSAARRGWVTFDRHVAQIRAASKFRAGVYQ